MLLVVVEDLLHRHDTRVLITSVRRAGLVLLVPVEDLQYDLASSSLPYKCAITYAADEGGDEGNAGLSASNGLREAEKKGEVAVDAVVTLELARSLDTLPGGRDLDEDALLLDTNGLVEGNELLRLRLGRLLVVGETGVDLSRDTAGDDLQDLLAELDELPARSKNVLSMQCKRRPDRSNSAGGTHEAIHSSADLVVDATTFALAELHGSVNETLVRGLVGRCEDERGVGGRVLGLVDIDG